MISVFLFLNITKMIKQAFVHSHKRLMGYWCLSVPTELLYFEQQY